MKEEHFLVDHDHMSSKCFLREYWSRSSFSSTSGASFQSTTSLCSARRVGGDLARVHRLFPSQRTLLRLLPRKLLWIFSLNLPGNFALKNGGDFGEFFPVSVPREARKLLKKFGEIRRAKFGAKFGMKIRKIRENFVLQLF